MDINSARKLLANQSTDDLIKIIVNLANISEDAEEWLLNYCDQHGKVADEGLILKKQIEHYWYVAEEIIDEANMYGGTSDDKESTCCCALFTIDDLASKNKHRLEWDFRKSIIDSMMTQFHVGNSGFEHNLMDSCLNLCEKKDEYLYLAGEIGESSEDYFRNLAAELYLKYGEGERFAELQSRNLHYGEDYIRLADYYMQQKQNDKAVKLVEEAIDKAKGALSDVYQWLGNEYKKHGQEDKLIRLYNTALKRKKDIDTISAFMYEYYKNDYDKKKPYLLKTMETCDSSSAKAWFEECRFVLLPEDYEKESNRLHALLKEKSLKDYLQVRIDEGEKAEVLKYLQENPITVWGYYSNADLGHKFSKQLADAFPKEICTLYWNECESLCDTADKKYYPQAVSVLKEICSICRKSEMETEWQTEFDSFLERHRRKKILINLIAQEKTLK